MRKQTEMAVLAEIVEIGKFYWNGNVRMSQNGCGRPNITVKLIRILLVPVIFLLMYGCTPTLIKMEQEELIHLKDQPDIQAVHYPPQNSFEFFRSGLTGGGVLLTLIDAARGSKMAKDYSLTDPILKVKDRFLSSLDGHAGFKNIRSIQEPHESDDLEEVKRTFGTGVVIDFKTYAWGLSESASALMIFRERYYVTYWARTRMIRLADSKIIWQGFCKIEGQDQKALGEFTANNGELLKVKLNEAADACAEQLLAQFFGQEKPEKQE